MRILFLTQWFQPESFFKGLPFAKALKDKGHEVEVLTGFPNYPGGEVYEGYRVRLYQREVMDGVTVHRVPLYPSHDKSALRRIVNYISFSLSAFLMGPWLIKKPDVIYVYNLITLGPPAFLLRLIYGAKVIIDVQDLWPESIASSGMLWNKWFLGALNGICNWVYRKADQLVVLSPGFKNHLMSRGVPPEKIQMIYNWCNESDMQRSVLPASMGEGTNDAGKFVVLYAGAMGSVQGLDAVLDCAEICKTKLPNVQFLLIGDGADRQRLAQLGAEKKLDNVGFLPRRTIETMGEVYAMADALLVHLKDYPLFRITIPSKTQAYLYMGKPIIMAVRGDAATLVEQAQAGILCEPDNPNALVDAVRTLYKAGAVRRREMGESGYCYYMNHLSFEQGVKNFEDTMLSLAGLEEKNGVGLQH